MSTMPTSLDVSNLAICKENALKVVNEEIMLNAVYLNGQWVTIEVTHESDAALKEQNLFDPSSAELIAKTRLASAHYVDQAARAAEQAFEDWSNTAVSDRARYLSGIADEMQKRFDKLVSLSVLNNGKPIVEAELDVNDAIACYRYYAKLIQNQPSQSLVETGEPSVRLYKCNEPVGVCALIVPWNFPMVTTAWKLAPALAAGCTVLLKPSEVTLLPELMLGNILEEINLPKGVVNILPGGADVGAAMTSHPLVDKISFTGSNVVGEKVMVQAAQGIKDISLELGGKSAIVVRADANIDLACELIVGGIFANCGQICSATSRLLVHADIAQTLFSKLKIVIEALIVGDGFDSTTQMGPLVSEAQFKQVKKYFDIAADEQLACLTGGQTLQQEGYFVMPTVYTEVPTTSRLWREEIFGPVLVTQTFSSDEEAVKLANDSQYALAASVVSTNEQAAMTLARQIRAGHVWINEFQIVLPEAGWGGFKQSGIGRELGEDGLSAYQKSKHILLPN
ncbi:MAG: aldehyde dehydrogenase family protein [Psychrobacter sp.]|nr:aldehyde dehydrogenase family protein [Psychrobacter sp.]